MLTRLPTPARRTPKAVSQVLTGNFPHSRFLSARRAADLLERLAGHHIAGGSVYDALVGEATVEHGLALVTRDRRALDTYRALGVEVRLIG